MCPGPRTPTYRCDLEHLGLAEGNESRESRQSHRCRGQNHNRYFSMFPTLNKLNLNPKIKTHNGLAASVGVKTYSLQIFLLPIINEP